MNPQQPQDAAATQPPQGPSPADAGPTPEELAAQAAAERALLSPAERLALSRARIRGFLIDPDGGKRRRKATVGDASSLPGIDLLMAKLHEHPMAAAVMDAVSNWWKSHPVHAFGVIAGSTLRDAAGPLVRRHPVAMVAAAVLAGAVLVRMRPWRLVLKSALFAGLASQVASRVIAAVPIDTVIGTLMKFAGGRREAPSPAPPPP